MTRSAKIKDNVWDAKMLVARTSVIIDGRLGKARTYAIAADSKEHAGMIEQCLPSTADVVWRAGISQ